MPPIGAATGLSSSSNNESTAGGERRSGPSLVEIKTKHYLQCSNPVTVSAFTTLIAELNSAREEDRRGANQVQRDERIDWFRQEWFLGAHSRTKPLELLPDGESEVYSDGAAAAINDSETASLLSVLSEDRDDRPPAAAAVTEPEARRHLVPPDDVSRGLLAERTIKRALSRRNAGHSFLRHKDYASLAAVARRAIRRTLCTDQSVYVSPGLLDAVDWTNEYTARGWAAPGIRWSAFKPDLIRFHEIKKPPTGASKISRGERTVVWEVVEIKYSNKPRDFIYTNFKIQAVFYHLSLARILSNVPSLAPSHKVTFFLSRDPLSAAYEERSVSLRTEQAFVEHHLFVLLPTWLEAVTQLDWDRLQAALREPASTPAKVVLITAPASAPEQTTPERAKPLRQTFLEKLQASVKAALPSPSRPRRRRGTPPAPTPIEQTTRAYPDAKGDAATSPTERNTTSPSNPHTSTSPPLSDPLRDEIDLSSLPPLPDPPEDEEQDLLADLLGGLGI
ncbi:hypothetical protein JCM3774_004207 [Rhodotorula dairenensis]